MRRRKPIVRWTELSKKINVQATEKGDEAGEEGAEEIETRLKGATRRKSKRAA